MLLKRFLGERFLDELLGGRAHMQAPAEWTRFQSSFDSVPEAMLTLFIVASMEGWHHVMFHAADGTGPDQQPSRDSNPLACYYFIAFVLLGSFFMISLFATTIFENFIKLKQHMEGFGFLAQEQQKWIEMHKRLASSLPTTRIRAPPRPGASGSDDACRGKPAP